MCGRFTMNTPAEVVAELFELAEMPLLTPRFNIAPTQPVPVVLWDRDLNRRQLDLLRWGLIPSWADDPRAGDRLINARVETVATKPAFRAAFRHRRCLVVADGFYEWQKLSRRRQPFYIRMQDGGAFAFAGLWERWRNSDGGVIDSCAILTTEANELVRPVHARMPVILPRQAYAQWLDPEVRNADSLTSLLRPLPPGEMVAYAVSTEVNSPVNDTAACIEPLH